MITVVLVIHIMIAISLVGTVLLQRSEGGALGIGGGGGGGGGFLSGRGAANVLTRATAILAAGFFATSIILSLLAGSNGPATSIIQSTVPTTSGQSAPSDQPSLPVLPQSPAPAAPQAPVSQ